MPQLIVECSDPGVVVSLAEEFETILRQIDFARAQELQRQLGDLAHELGSAFEATWRARLHPRALRWRRTDGACPCRGRGARHCAQARG